MKKNIAMRVAAILFILTMISTCAFSTTFAKYVTSDEATDTARVAKWGVEVNLAGFEMYDTNYDGTVISSTTDKLVAPGTGSELAGISITGKPEVKVEVKYEATLVLDEEEWKIGSDEYCPIIFTVNTETYGTNDTNATHKSTDIAALIVAVEEAIEAYTAEYDANADLNTATTPSVSWAWAYSTSDANDVKDTALGDAAAAGNAPTISLELTVTVTQVD